MKKFILAFSILTLLLVGVVAVNSVMASYSVVSVYDDPPKKDKDVKVKTETTKSKDNCNPANCATKCSQSGKCGTDKKMTSTKSSCCPSSKTTATTVKKDEAKKPDTK